MISIGVCGVAYYIVVSLVGESYIMTLTVIGVAVLLYGLCSLKIKAVDSQDILLLPKGDKIEKILRKVKLL